ncbi:MAG: DUF6364 family protein [Gemmatimonadaceae bacterium]|nr:DUF6364 family protein [Gemmatimonadaceae bacterium]
MAKVVKNLTLDPEAVKRGERYSRRKGTSVSQIVSDFLSRLPDDGDSKLSPTVGRLLGIARGKGDEEAYRRYLEKKYAK